MTQQPWTPASALTLIVLGLALLGLGLGWSAVVPSSVYWGPEQAEEYIAAQTDLHNTTHDHGHDGNHAHDFAAARERFVKISEQLDAARTSRDRTGTYLIGAGILSIVVGICIHLGTKPPG